MSLDFELISKNERVIFDANITHNLNTMADIAGIYKCLWMPNENGYVYAKDIIHPLAKGIYHMMKHPEYYKTFNPKNGWGNFDDFLPWLLRVLAACYEHKDAKIRVSR